MRHGHAALFLLIALSTPGCEADDVVSPAAAQETTGPATEASYDNLTDRELMIAVLQRLDSLESRVEREAVAARTQLEDLLTGGEGGLLALAQADRERSRGTEQCLEIKVGSEAELEQLTKVLGNAFAGIGAWAGTGGTANLKAVAELRAKIQPLKGAIEVKKSWCFGRGATRDPFVGNLTASGGMASAQASDPQAVEAAMAAAVARLGLTEARALEALDRLSSAGSSLPDCRPGDCARTVAGTLPIPTELRAILDDPRTFIQQRAPDFSAFSLDQLCAGLFPGAFGERLSQACELRDRVPDTAQLFGTYEALVGIPELVAEIDDRLSIVCSRTHNLIEGVRGFSIEQHGPFSSNILWPGPAVPVLGTGCTVLRSS